jgi:enoyl-CoA hydratase/carnithine racemase
MSTPLKQQSSETEPLILAGKRGGVATLCLNRPKQFNALSEAMLDALQSEFDALAADKALRCVVLSATGKAFCAGHDLAEMRSNNQYHFYQSLFARCSRLMQGIRTLPVPVIARVQGIATAAGCQLVGACDLAIASESARFAVSGINVGLFCATPAVPLSRNVSTKRAFDMLMTGRFIDAATALDWGLINEVVPDADIDAAIARKTADILGKSPAAIRYGKAMFYAQQSMPLKDAYEYAGAVMARNMLEEDVAEGIDAFLNKRRPVWTS